VTIHARRTKAQMDQLRRQLCAALGADHPQSVRHLFYRMTDPGLPEPVAKSFGGYITVQRLLVRMRREGIVPSGWITTSPAGGRASREDSLEGIGRG
jgi:hypothetical protein